MGTHITAYRKQSIIRDYAERRGIRYFFETGTSDADTLGKMAPHFDLLISVELDDLKYHLACEAFLYEPRVKLIHGDSGLVVERMAALLDQPTLFWLDAHADGTTGKQPVEVTPIERELWYVLESAVSNGLNHCVLVDDARLFGTVDGYPHREWVKQTAVSHGYSCTIEADMFRLTKDDS